MLSLQIYIKNETEEKNLISKDFVLAGLATFDLLLIISIEPQVNLIYKQNKPEYIKEGTIIYLSWGTGILPGFLVEFFSFLEIKYLFEKLTN